MTKPSRRLTITLLVLILLLGFGLRVYRLGAAGIWGDEAFSIRLAQGPLAAALAVGADLHPPLYHALLHFWLILAGSSEFGARFLSLMAGVTLIPGVYVVGRRLAGTSSGLIAAGLVAVSPFAVYYSQEARMYALAALLATLSVYFAARVWDTAAVGTPPQPGFAWSSGVQHSPTARLRLVQRGPAPGTRKPRRPGTRIRGNPELGYFVFTLAAMYSHFYVFLVIAAEDLFALWLWRKRPEWLWRWIAGQAGLVVAFLPWLIPQIGFFTGRAQSRAGALSLDGLGEVFAGTLKAFSLGQPTPDWLTPVLPLMAALALIGLFILLRPSARTGGRFAALYLLLPLPLAWLTGPLLNYFNPRFLLLALPAYLILIAAGLGWLGEGRRWPIAALALAGTLAGSGLALGRLYTDPAYAKSGYREMMAAIREQSRPGDALFLLNPEQTALFDYYGDQSLPKLVFPLPGDLADAPNQAKLAKVEQEDKRIWLVMFGNARDWDPGSSLQNWLTGHAFRAWRGALIDTQVELYVIGQVEPEPTTPVDYGGLIRLEGYGVSAQSLSAGDTLQIALAWAAGAKMDRDYTIFTHLIDDQGKVIGQFDSPPMGGAHPTSAWEPGEKNVDRFGIVVDPATQPGKYWLEVGWYDLATLKRIPVLDAQGSKIDDRALLIQIEVR